MALNRELFAQIAARSAAAPQPAGRIGTSSIISWLRPGGIMNRRSFLQGAVAAPVLAANAQPASAGIELPPPAREGGMPLMTALNRRQSIRKLSATPLTPQQLSNVLWAAFGVNRTDGRRTAPTAMNVQDIGIYVLLEQGAYVYDPARHALTLVTPGDQRAAAGSQDVIARAPACLVFVSDQGKYAARQRPVTGPALLAAWSNVHAGYVSQNVYLCAASEGLGTCVRGSVDAAALAKVLGLGPAHKPLYTQTIGAPA
jgi:SagB-type dehydrogenase family enzyme